MNAQGTLFKSLGRSFSALLLAGLASASLHSRPQYLSVQQTQPGGQTIRVNVGLVQTDVMVFDRQGRFVPDLKLDQFELRVDGKVQPISFLELVSAGSPHDEEIWAKADAPAASPRTPPAAGAGSNPGRTLLFFLDDWHMDVDDVQRARTALINLLNTSMGAKDRVGVFAASGQLRSLQELTSDKAALLASLEKFNFLSAGAQDLEYPPMTEAQALLIEQNDWNAITYFVQAIVGQPVVKDQRGWQVLNDRSGSVASECNRAEALARRRAAALAQTSAAIGDRTLSGLRSLLSAAEGLPGRKLVFFLSDGFVLQPQASDIVSKITDLTSAAAHAGIVIYSLDTRGLVVGLPNARTKRAPDMTGALAASGANEVAATQDALNALASDTGGRFLKNTNALDTALITALADISRYYLIGWPIDLGAVKPGKYSSLRVAIKGRPDLNVRVRQGSLDLSRLISSKDNQPFADGPKKEDTSRGEPTSSLWMPQPTLEEEIEIYSKARSVVDLTREELLQAFPNELRDLRFEDNQGILDSLLLKAGERVSAFFLDFPNCLAKEQVRRERLSLDGRVVQSVSQNFSYSFSPDKTGNFWEETRTDSEGHSVKDTTLSGFSFLTWGYAGMSMFFHPSHHAGSRFRYLGRQISNQSYVIAFAQKPAVGDYLGSYQSATMRVPALIMYQGLAWVDPQTFQIVRMRTDLLAPRSDVGLPRQSSDIRFSAVQFKSSVEPFWLPQEAIVTSISGGQMYRNRHRYSDYAAFTVAVQEKISPAPIKK